MKIPSILPSEGKHSRSYLVFFCLCFVLGPAASQSTTFISKEIEKSAVAGTADRDIRRIQDEMIAFRSDLDTLFQLDNKNEVVCYLHVEPEYGHQKRFLWVVRFDTVSIEYVKLSFEVGLPQLLPSKTKRVSVNDSWYGRVPDAAEKIEGGYYLQKLESKNEREKTSTCTALLYRKDGDLYFGLFSLGKVLFKNLRDYPSLQAEALYKAVTIMLD